MSHVTNVLVIPRVHESRHMNASRHYWQVSFAAPSPALLCDPLGVYVLMGVRVYAHRRAFMCACVRVYACVCAHLCARVYVCVYVRVYVRVCVCNTRPESSIQTQIALHTHKRDEQRLKRALC